MKRRIPNNPYLNALSSIGILGVVLGIILIVSNASRYSNQGLVALGGAMFGFGALSLLFAVTGAAIAWNHQNVLSADKFHELSAEAEQNEE